MKTNNPQPDNRRLVLVFALISLLIVGGIIFLKKDTSAQRPLNGAEGGDGSSAPVAVPDTTVPPDVLPVAADTVVPDVLPDTILGKDRREAYEAGFEDGYQCGCDDGAMGEENVSYDETNSYPSRAERDQYVKGYREGYARGLEDGKAGKQFNI